MVKLTIRNDDGTVDEYDFVPRQLHSPEAEAIEENGGMAWETFEEFGIKFMRGSHRAYRVALWICRRRMEPRLRLQDVNIRIDQLEVDYSDDEKSRIRQAIEADPELETAQRENLLELIDSAEATDAASASIAQGVDLPFGPKDPSADSGQSGSLSPVTA